LFCSYTRQLSLVGLVDILHVCMVITSKRRTELVVCHLFESQLNSTRNFWAKPTKTYPGMRLPAWPNPTHRYLVATTIGLT